MNLGQISGNLRNRPIFAIQNHPMELLIREARKEDMPAVLQLIKELADFEKEPHEVEVNVAELEEAGFGKQPQFHCFLAEINGEVVGMALTYLRFSTWKGKVVHLEDLIVKESLRNTGIGTALYRKVMEYAQALGVKRVNWEVLDWNKPAIQFYEKSGATIMESWRPVHMRKEALEKYLKG